MKILKGLFASIGKKVAVATALVVASASSVAAVPAVLGTALTGIETDSLAVVDLGWPIVLSITGAFVLFKIVKRIVRQF